MKCQLSDFAISDTMIVLFMYLLTYLFFCTFLSHGTTSNHKLQRIEQLRKLPRFCATQGYVFRCCQLLYTWDDSDVIFCLPPCWRFATLQHCNVVKLCPMLANRCLSTYSPVEVHFLLINLAEEIRIFFTLFVHIQYTTNMALWFCASFNDVVAPHV